VLLVAGRKFLVAGKMFLIASKIFLIASKMPLIAGKLFGLHSGDGHVMWSLTYPPSQAPQHIFPWRSSHDIQRAPELIALHSSDSASSYSVVDAHTGRELSSAALSFSVSQVCLNPTMKEITPCRSPPADLLLCICASYIISVTLLLVRYCPNRFSNRELPRTVCT